MIECAVCLEPIAHDMECHTECGHVFHSSCALRAIRNDPRCCICRTPLVPEENKAAKTFEFGIGSEEFEATRERISRLRRNYQSRRRRAESMNVQLTDYKQKWKTAAQNLRHSQNLYIQHYNQALKNIHCQFSVRVHKLATDKLAQRERVIRQKYVRLLQQVMGETEPISFVEYIVEQLQAELSNQ